jgi:hypothetical protein
MEKLQKVLDKKVHFYKNNGINSKGAVDSSPRRLFFMPGHGEYTPLIFLEEEKSWILVFGF